MRALLVGLSLVPAVLSVASAQEAAPPAEVQAGKRWVISAGVSEYSDWDIPGRVLGDFYAGAVGLPLTTRDLGNVPLEQAAVLGGNSATRLNIRQSLETVATGGPEDALFMYLCLTPAVVADADGGAALYLCTYETKKDDIAGSGLAISDLAALLGACPAQRKVVFLDCSPWDPFRAEDAPPDLVPADTCLDPLKEVCSLVVAASPGEKLAEQGLARPLLGYCLSTIHPGCETATREGGEALLDGDGELTMAEVWLYIKSTAGRVYEGAEAKQTPSAGGVKIERTVYYSLPKTEGRCPPGMRLVGDRVCVDLYEAPNVVGAAPLANRNLFAFINICQQAGKRTCMADEWEEACLGPDNLRFGYSNVPQAGACNLGWGDPELARAERIGSRPLCVNGYGLYDMIGNVAEYVGNSSPTADVRGGSFRDVAVDRSDCRSEGVHHSVMDSDHVGGRCCADPR